MHGELHERTKRLTQAVEARAIGFASVALVSEITGLGRATIRPSCRNWTRGSRVRRPGGRGRRIDAGPMLGYDLDRLVEPVTCSDSMFPLRWTVKSKSALVRELQTLGYEVGPTTVAVLLKKRGNRRTGHLGRRQEKGTARRLQESGPGMGIGTILLVCNPTRLFLIEPLPDILVANC